MPLAVDKRHVADLSARVAERLHADQYVEAGEIAAEWFAERGVTVVVKDREKAIEVCSLLLHWLLENDGYEEAANLLWGRNLFDPSPESAQRVWRAFEDSNFILLMGAASMCFSPETPCRFFDGSVRRADEVVVGNFLMGDDGKPREVLETHGGLDQMFRIAPTNGAPAFECNSRHILTLSQRGETVDIPLPDFLRQSDRERGKYQLIHQGTDGVNRLVDFCVEEIEFGPYVGFEVDGNHRFLLGSGLVVHNSKSYSMGVRLMLEYIRDPEYTNIKVLGPSEQHLEDNLFSHLVALHRQSTLPLPGEIGKLFIGGDTRSRKGSISGVVVPLGKKAAGRIQGSKRVNRKKAHPKFGLLSRMFIFLDEIANIPVGIWKDLDNVIASSQGDNGLKIIGAFNPTNMHDEVGKRAEFPGGWQQFDLEQDVDWTSTRGWRVVRLDAARCENVVRGRTVYPGLQTKQGFEKLIENAGGTDSAGYYSMGRGCFPPAGVPMSIFPAGLLTSFRGEPIWYDRPTPVGSVDMALMGGDTAVFAKGAFGMASGVKYPPSLEHPLGRTLMFKTKGGQSLPHGLLFVEGLFKLPKAETVGMKSEIVRVCRAASIRAEHLCVDRTGNGQGVYDLLRHDFGEVLGVNYSQSATDTRILAEDHAPPKELYDRIQSELWFATRKFVEFHYCQLAADVPTEELFPQLTQRRYKPTGKKSKVESKEEYQSRCSGKSPDEADAFTLLVHVVRHAFAFVPGMLVENSSDTAEAGYENEEEGPRIDHTNRYEDL